MKNLMLTVAFTLAGGALFAQATPATPATPATSAKPEAAVTEKAHPQDKKACSMPDMGAVETLGLTNDQLIQVRTIHAECERDCAASKEKTGEMDHALMARHQERIKEVLTPEQYERYQALASERKMEKREMKDAHKAH